MRGPRLLALLLLGLPPAAAAGVPLPFDEFLRQMTRGNLELAAQRFSVPLAEAQVAAASVFPDPTFTGGLAALDVSGEGQPTATLLQVEVPIELGGKRGARVAAARADVSVARLQIEEALRTLRAAAAAAYVDAVQARLVLGRKRKTLESLEGLVRLNEQRLRAGDIGEVALVHSRVEARRFAGEVHAAQAEARARDLVLVQLLGASRAPWAGAELELPEDLVVPPRTFTADALLAAAQGGRLDLRAQRLAGEAAAARVRLARANRWIDVTVGVSWTRNQPTEAPAFAQPRNDLISATLSAPVPLSRVYRGELRAAEAERQQRLAQVQALELQVEIEIRQALARYEAAVARVRLFPGLLSDADGVLQAMLYNYQRGGATLLEVLNAQRTVDEVYIDYYEALAGHIRALIAVEQAAGIWDVAL